jgi:hypothetical protein
MSIGTGASSEHVLPVLDDEAVWKTGGTVTGME